jgi:hypothetical protein
VNPAVGELRALFNPAVGFAAGWVTDTVHEYMVRRSYMDKCKLLDTFYYDNGRTQEPQFVLPLGIGGGRLYHIDKPLYRYLRHDDMMSARNSFNDFADYFEQYQDVELNVIDNLGMPECRRSVLALLAKMENWNRVYTQACIYGVCEAFRIRKWADALMQDIPDELNQIVGLNSCGLGKDHDELTTVLKDVLARKLEVPYVLNRRDGKVIAWGALGKRARTVLPVLALCGLKPDLLWDADADGVFVQKPDADILTDEDVVAVLPVAQSVQEDIYAQLESSGCTVMLAYDIDRLLDIVYRRQIYNELYDWGER